MRVKTAEPDGVSCDEATRKLREWVGRYQAESPGLTVMPAAMPRVQVDRDDDGWYALLPDDNLPPARKTANSRIETRC